MQAINLISRYVITVLVVASSISCKSDEEHKVMPILEAEIPSEINIVSGPTINISALANLVKDLEGLTRLEGDNIGIGAAKSSQKDYAGQLAKHGDTSSLILLTKHASPYVRISSYEALLKKEYPSMLQILEDHLTDSETFNLYSGCLVTPEPVNLTMFNLVEDKLNEFERNVYRKKIVEQLRKLKYYGVGLL